MEKTEPFTTAHRLRGNMVRQEKEKKLTITKSIIDHMFSIVPKLPVFALKYIWWIAE